MTYLEFLEEWRNDSDVIKVHTSGSTGTPKEILLPKSFMIESAERTINFFSLDSSTHFHSCISPDFIGGKMMAVRADLLNAPFTFEQPSNQPRLSVNYKIPDFIAMVPSQLWGVFKILENTRISEEIKAGIKKANFLIGGGIISKDFADKSLDLHINCWESYGMTETASHIALRRVGEKYFTPMDNISISQDERDCLVINIPSIDSPIITNDIVNLNSDNSFEILGRFDNMIISGGKKIMPEKIEKTIRPYLKQLGLKEIMASAIKDSLWGEKLVLYVESEKSGDNKDDNLNKKVKDSILEICRKELEKWEIPKEIIYRESIPKTINGKLKRI